MTRGEHTTLNSSLSVIDVKPLQLQVRCNGEKLERSWWDAATADCKEK